MIKYKIDVIKELKEAGYNTTRIRREGIMGESSVQHLRDGEYISFANLNTICKILDLQPGNIIKYVEDPE